MEFEHSQTYRLLGAAWAQALQSAALCQLGAAAACQENIVPAQALLSRVAGQEQAHAGLWLGWLLQNTPSDTAWYLQQAAARRRRAWREEYPVLARTAREENFLQLAELADNLSRIAKAQEVALQRMTNQLQQDTLFCRKQSVFWICQNCGHTLFSAAAPEQCPVCQAKKGCFLPQNAPR